MMSKATANAQAELQNNRVQATPGSVPERNRYAGEQ